MAEENTTTPTEEQTTTTTTTSINEQSQISPLDKKLQEKRGQLIEAQITQTNAYSDYMKVMKAKTIVDEKDTEKVAKLDELLFEHFTTYQHALEEAHKLQFELSELESQIYLEDILA